jgi:hypothetical protein
MPRKKSMTYIAYKEAMAAAPPPLIINSKRESDVADGDDEDSTPTISPTALLLLRKLASKNITINREREMRKSGESNYLFEEQVKLIKATVEARRDRKVSLDILDEARREGVEMMASQMRQ